MENKEFWKSNEGKILNYGIHEHIHACSRITRNIKLIKRDFDKLSKEEIFKKLDIIFESKEKCKGCLDYIYTEIKKLSESNEFKIGSRVKITACLHGHEFEIGDIVTIIEREDEYEESVSWRAINKYGVDWYITEEEGVLTEESYI